MPLCVPVSLGVWLRVCVSELVDERVRLGLCVRERLADCVGVPVCVGAALDRAEFVSVPVEFALSVVPPPLPRLGV